MKKSGLAFADLERVVVTTGPGSFTGLRVGISAARGFGVATDIPVVGVTTLSAYAAPYLAADDQIPVVVAIDARHEHVYLQVFGPGGRTLIAPRLAPLNEAVRAASDAPARIVGSAAKAVAAGLPKPRRRRSPSMPAKRPISPGSRKSAPSCRKRKRRRSRNICVRPTRSRKTPPRCRGDDRLSWHAYFRAARPLSPTRGRAMPQRSPRIHGASFQRGWGEDEIYRLLIEKNVVAHRALSGRKLIGFILSRLAAGEAEILSVAIAPSWRGRKLCAALARPAFAPLGGAWHARGISRSERAQCARDAALSARRFS